jgi:hypothetical protein
VSILVALIKALAPIKKGLKNGGISVDKGLLVCSDKDEITRNSIFRDLQSICELYLPSQENPRITGAKRILII